MIFFSQPALPETINFFWPKNSQAQVKNSGSYKKKCVYTGNCSVKMTQTLPGHTVYKKTNNLSIAYYSIFNKIVHRYKKQNNKPVKQAAAGRNNSIHPAARKPWF